MIPTKKIALIGYGEAGVILHGPLIAATDGLELVAIVTADPVRRAAAACAYPDTRILANVADVWRSDADAVVIATPVRSHVPLAERALEAGKAVVVDKPLAASAAEAERVVALAAARGLPFSTFQNRRWDSGFLAVRAILARGRVGRPYRFESRFERYRAVVPDTWQESADPLDGGGILLDLGSHAIDQAIQLFGSPTSIAAEIQRRRPGSVVDDDVFLALEFAGDVMGQLWLSQIARASGPAFRLIGSAAAFEIDGSDPQWGAPAAAVRPGGPDWGRQRESGVLTSGDADTETVRRIRPPRGSWDRFYAGFRDALQGAGPVPVDPRDAVDVLRVIETARRSAASGRRLPIRGLRPRPDPVAAGSRRA